MQLHESDDVPVDGRQIHHPTSTQAGVRALSVTLLEKPRAPLVVFAQVHYPDIWQSISALLARRMTVPFHLVVTTSQDPAEVSKPKTRYLRSFRVQSAENRGRDVLPFLRALAETTDYEIGLKIHTKKSPQRADGAQWLSELLESLLPSRQGVAEIVAKIAADPRIGFVAPRGFCLPVKPWVLQNGAAMEAVMADIGHKLTDDDMSDAFFAAGNMFWFRRTALQGLAVDSLPALFEPEAAQLDGTVAHAMERIFPIEARRQGFLTVAMPALLRSGPHQTAEAIMNATRLHAEEPNFLFPAPYQSPESAEYKLPVRESLMQRVMPFASAVPPSIRRIVGRIIRGRRSANIQ